MSVVTFDTAILLMGVWTREMLHDAKRLKDGFGGLKFTTSINLN